MKDAVTSTVPREEWGRNVAAARRARKMGQRDLADAVGVTQQAISRIERGTPPRDETRIRLATALHCQVDDLFPWPTITFPPGDPMPTLPLGQLAPAGNPTHRTANFYPVIRTEDDSRWSAVRITPGNHRTVAEFLASLTRIARRDLGVSVGPDDVGRVLVTADVTTVADDPIVVLDAGDFEAAFVDGGRP